MNGAEIINNFEDLFTNSDKHEFLQQYNEFIPQVKDSHLKQQFKVVFLGEGNVGKTCLIQRICKNTFSKRSLTTVGVDWNETTFTLVGDIQVKIQLWDFSGQKMFENMRKQFYTGAGCAIIVFDLLSPKTFALTPNWIDEAKTNSGNYNIPIIIVGNKYDLTKNKLANDYLMKMNSEYLKIKTYLIITIS